MKAKADALEKECEEKDRYIAKLTGVSGRSRYKSGSEVGVPEEVGNLPIQRKVA